MKIHKTFITLSICTLSVFAIGDALKPSLVNAQSQEQKALSRCRKFVKGSYLTTIIDADGNFASRGVITLTQDGNLFVTDSNQGGVQGSFNPFGDTQGAYKCKANAEITATGINFGFSGNDGVNDIARSDLSASFDRKTNQTIKGTITVRSFDLEANPLEDEGSVVGTFSFTGQRINAGVR